MIPAVEISGLRKHYRRVEALRGIDLVVPSGSVFGFLGPNGAGKSTTMKILMGLIRQSEGTAHVLGRDVRDGTAVRAQMGYLPQNPSFYDRMRVYRVLQFVARRFMAGSRQAINDRVEETLALVGLSGKEARRVGDLSGGELRRLGIAQAYIGHPELLILDEPSVGLDPAGRREVIDLLDALRQHTTVFYSTHILDDVQRIADHIAVLDHGQIISQGSIDEFLSSGEASYRIGLGGDGEPVINSLAAEPWVATTTPLGDGAWKIAATDRAAAEAQLAPHLLAQGAVVTEIRPEQRSLEEIYLEITEGSDQEEEAADGD
jgi:ABC-2 type transport system ATP-binding protein